MILKVDAAFDRPLETEMLACFRAEGSGTPLNLDKVLVRVQELRLQGIRSSKLRGIIRTAAREAKKEQYEGDSKLHRMVPPDDHLLFFDSLATDIAMLVYQKIEETGDHGLPDVREKKAKQAETVVCGLTANLPSTARRLIGLPTREFGGEEIS
ncbi:hypothetical protein A2706_05410 [Candidatus Peribacteria bacterium RIFCSPHIGHO2_01_FULL_51_35]|nr:MAG: hypothetical protein A2706_05410 [Candidatus Peribacteria bacterium RIFCSPHIGHO2_01_FULL_51_35]